MQNFDSLTLKAFIQEYAPRLELGHIQKIKQPSRREVILIIRSFKETFKFYINIHPQYPHICCLNQDIHPISTPKQPPMFCMLLRKYLENSKILQIIQPPFERIVELHLEYYNEIGEKCPIVLAIELMGKHSNIILYNPETSIIIGCAHNIGSEKSRYREIAGGLRYIYPQEKLKKNLLATSFQEIAQGFLTPQSLNENYYDISIPLAKELLNSCNSDKKALFELAQNCLSLKNLKPSISFDYEEFSLFSLNNSDLQQENINSLIEKYFGHFVLKNSLYNEKIPLKQIVQKEIKKHAKNIEIHQKTIEKSSKAETYKQMGDILSANLHQLKNNQKTANLYDFYQNKEIEIPLEENLSIKENIQKYYKLYNKNKNAKKIATDLLEKSKNELEYLKTIQNSIEQAEKLSIIEEIKEELSSKKLLKTISSKPTNKINIDEITIDGFKILIGKNNKQNDYIITKLSAPNDLWLHTLNTSGGHILIKMPPNLKTPPDNVLLEAAKLAVYYSSARNSLKVDVTCTSRKNLKKPPASNLGYVTFTNETNIIVDNNEPTKYTN